VQIAGAVLFSFLLFYFKSIPQPVTQSTVAMISAITLTVAFPTTILIGRLSDHWGPRKPFLIGAVIVAAVGLLTMAAHQTTVTAIIGYAIFECSVAIFLALHSAYAMQVLPSPSRRGRDMGILNLTNTFPSLIAPILAVGLVPGHGFSTLFVVIALLMVVAVICLGLIRSDRQSGQLKPMRPSAQLNVD
jgi:MFS family permease